MADTGAAVNGIYTNQYAQPAELAASTPSATSSHGPSASQSTTTSAAAAAAAQKADPTEIGWYFVEQYYTTLSKTPERIHLFYNRKSQLVTGNEAEKIIPAVGFKAISEKIKSLDFQDCKVRVLNVDSQASFSNIVVQVIGEMSNKNQPHHKFVQTFVLAEQPNGYFVLNDIFRYLNDDEDEIVDDEPTRAEVPAEEPSTPAEADVPEPQGETVTTESAAEQVDKELEGADEEPSVAAQVPTINGEDHEAIEEGALAGETVTEAVEESAEADPEPEEPSAVEEEEKEEPQVETEQPKASTPAPEAPQAAPTKKTWANLVGGSASPAVPALPAKQSATTQQPKAPRPVSQAQPAKAASTEPAAASAAGSQDNGWHMAGENKKGKSSPQAKTTDSNTLAYIKNVNDKVDARTLREVLERYGELKYFDVSRPRNCAFVEFATPEGYAAAVAANPHSVNTETIQVEERRPRPGAYGGPGAQFARGNGQAGRGRGGNHMQQRTNSQGQNQFPKDAGRGGFQQQRGGKSGTTTPRGGRGQAQAV